MDDVKQMFRKIINGQSAMKAELLTRLDKIGLAVARLEDDAPTIEEFDKLEKRVTKVELKASPTIAS